jgi:putative toxin-antitoxin system antitoxin component (TIGR02293 family)
MMSKLFSVPPGSSVRTPLQKTFNLGAASYSELAEMVEAGASYGAFSRGAAALGLSENRFADILGIPSSTLARRRKAKRLSLEESERLFRFVQLLERATDVLEDAAYARAWLETPNDAFGGRSPLAMARTEPGAQAVHNLLTRVEHGVFS